MPALRKTSRPSSNSRPSEISGRLHNVTEHQQNFLCNHQNYSSHLHGRDKHSAPSPSRATKGVSNAQLGPRDHGNRKPRRGPGDTVGIQAGTRLPYGLGYSPGEILSSCGLARHPSDCTADLPGRYTAISWTPRGGLTCACCSRGASTNTSRLWLPGAGPLCWAPMAGGSATVKYVPSPATRVGGRFPCRGERPPEDTEWISTCSRPAGRCSRHRSCLTRSVAAP